MVEMKTFCQLKAGESHRLSAWLNCLVGPIEQLVSST